MPEASTVRRMFAGVAPRYDLLNHLLSLGIDRRWRRDVVSGLNLKPSDRVLDLCCGTGDLALELAPHARCLACDFTWEMLTRAKAKSTRGRSSRSGPPPGRRGRPASALSRRPVRRRDRRFWRKEPGGFTGRFARAPSRTSPPGLTRHPGVLTTHPSPASSPVPGLPQWIAAPHRSGGEQKERGLSLSGGVHHRVSESRNLKRYSGCGRFPKHQLPPAYRRHRRNTHRDGLTDSAG